MTLLKPEETLHVYLRRHFERVSKGMARQFADMRDVAEVGAVADKDSSQMEAETNQPW